MHVILAHVQKGQGFNLASANTTLVFLTFLVDVPRIAIDTLKSYSIKLYKNNQALILMEQISELC